MPAWGGTLIVWCGHESAYLEGPDGPRKFPLKDGVESAAKHLTLGPIQFYETDLKQLSTAESENLSFDFSELARKTGEIILVGHDRCPHWERDQGDEVAEAEQLVLLRKLGLHLQATLGKPTRVFYIKLRVNEDQQQQIIAEYDLSDSEPH